MTWDHWDVKGVAIHKLPNLHHILKECAVEFDVLEVELMSPSRIQNTSDARNVYFLLSRRMTNNTLGEIGEFVNRHHTTVLHGIKQIEGFMKTEKLMIPKIERIRLKLLNKHI